MGNKSLYMGLTVGAIVGFGLGYLTFANEKSKTPLPEQASVINDCNPQEPILNIDYIEVAPNEIARCSAPARLRIERDAPAGTAQWSYQLIVNDQWVGSGGSFGSISDLANLIRSRNFRSLGLTGIVIESQDLDATGRYELARGLGVPRVAFNHQ